MVLLVRMQTPPWVLCLGLSKSLHTGKGPRVHKTQPCNHWSWGSEGGKVVLKNQERVFAWMHFWVLFNRVIVCVSLVVEELSNGKHSKLMSVTQHLPKVESFHKFMFFGTIFQYFLFLPLFQERKPSKNINDINFERENIWNKIEKSKFFGSMFEMKNAIFCVALFSSQVPTNKLAHCSFLGHCAISSFVFLGDEHHFFRAWMPLTQRRLPLAELCTIYPHHGATS